MNQIGAVQLIGNVSTAERQGTWEGFVAPALHLVVANEDEKAVVVPFVVILRLFDVSRLNHDHLLPRDLRFSQ